MHVWTWRQLQPSIASCSHCTSCISVVFPSSEIFNTKLKTTCGLIKDWIWTFIFQINVWHDRVARQNTFCHWQHLRRYWKVSYNVFLLICSDQEQWQCVCSRYIQQNSLLAFDQESMEIVALVKVGGSQTLLNQAHQFHTDFHHHIAVTWLSAPNLLFWPANQSKSENKRVFQQTKPLLLAQHTGIWDNWLPALKPASLTMEEILSATFLWL